MTNHRTKTTTEETIDMTTGTIRTMTEQFASSIEDAIAARTRAIIRDTVMVALPLAREISDEPNSPPPPPQPATTKTKPHRAKRYMPAQFCPVPKCKNKAAPVYGMVCADHRGVAKSKIKKFREERRVAKTRGGKR